MGEIVRPRRGPEATNFYDAEGRSHGEGVLRRLKEPADRQAVQDWLEAGPGR